MMMPSLPFEVPKPHESDHFRFELPLEIITPVLGGGTEKRALDRNEPVRAASIRGHLRLWWRATLSELPTDDRGRVSADALMTRERQIWGGVTGEKGDEDRVIKSPVCVRVSDVQGATKDESDIDFKTRGAYALWTARGTQHGETPAPRWAPGLRFNLTVSAPRRRGQPIDPKIVSEVKAAIRAWIVFGGYGGRTRRGLGALTVTDEKKRAEWLPARATITDVAALFPGVRFGADDETDAIDMPRLGAAGLALAPSVTTNAEAAWTGALDWLSNFRQGQPGHGGLGNHDPEFARVRGEHNRPSISNWPEPDKARHLGRRRTSHPPRHLDDPAWPRAGFGLPIQTRWQRRPRDGSGRYDEPNDFSLEWGRAVDGRWKKQDRIASPLFVGPMPLADGRFVSFALWLDRAYPKGGQVAMVVNGYVDQNSRAPFDKLLGTNDTAYFRPLEDARNAAQGHRLRRAFFDWLKTNRRLKAVEP